MVDSLIYYMRSGVIAGTAAGRHFNVPAQRGSGIDLGSWAKVEGLDVRWEVVEYGASVEREMTSDLVRSEPRLPLPEEALSCSHYTTLKKIALVADRSGGFLIHGLPPCNGKRCVIVREGWAELLRALTRESRGSMRIVG